MTRSSLRRRRAPFVAAIAACAFFSFAAETVAQDAKETPAAKHGKEPPPPAKLPPTPPAFVVGADRADVFDWTTSRPADLRRVSGRVLSADVFCRHCVEHQVQDPEAFKGVEATKALGRPLALAVNWSARTGGVPAATLSTRRSTLIAALGDGPVSDVTSDEWTRLRVWFPKLPPTAGAIDAHQAAHVYADRLAQIEAEAVRLLQTDDEGRLPSFGAYGRPATARAEVLLFATEDARRAAAAFLFGTEHRPVAVGLFNGAPVAVIGCDPKQPHVSGREFAFGAALALQIASAPSATGAAEWMNIGLAHVFERRMSATRGADDRARTLPADPIPNFADEPPADRDAFVADRVRRGLVGSWDALAFAGDGGLSIRNRLQAWSFTRYLIALDPAKYAALYARVHAPSTGRSEDAAWRAAFKETYGAEVGDADLGWRGFALDLGRAANK